MDFFIYCDASHSSFDGVLMLDKNIIDYASRQRNVREMNYPTHYLELPVVVFTLMNFRNYLYGVIRYLIIIIVCRMYSHKII